MVTKSVEGMAKTCSDGWACNNIWTPGAQVYTDVHTQNTALELLNTFSIVSKDGPSDAKSSAAKVDSFRSALFISVSSHLLSLLSINFLHT